MIGVQPTSSREALEEVRRCAVLRRVRLTRHAREESLPDRNWGIEDVMQALANARSCARQQSSEKWNVFGPSLDDDELHVVVVFDAGVLVVTVYGANE